MSTQMAKAAQQISDLFIPFVITAILLFSHILEPVKDRRSHENQIVGIELAFEALSLGGLIHLAFAKIDI
jgi:hypothetical protein